ncbi:LIM and SH3 domain protein 1-like [Varroa jacobsoni]|uniref:LIM and SH3 domain protein 1-like n=1 Tax=Varroa jacobsoni TaxID=62625 RepID=UPI000BF4FF23|nr:LIM and SH3 domain protein 1-like [Varroa jacobsoni]
MVNKKCARCLTTVYPIEELKCLDKVWHKQCFKCQECGMTLSMNTYKGFNRLPYCNAHVPHATYTTVLDTPEARRLAENTKFQSNVKYHEEYEKSKGRVTQVADDPEILRLSQQAKILSDVAYQGDARKTDPKKPLLNGDSELDVPGLDNFYEPVGNKGSGLHPKLYELYGSSNLSIPKYQVDDSVISFGPKFNAASLGDYEIYSPMGSLRRTKSCKAPSSNYNLNSYNQASHRPPSPVLTYNSQSAYSQQNSYQEARAPLQSQMSQSGGEPQSPQLPFEDGRMPYPGQSQFAAALNALKKNAPSQSFGFGSSQQPSQLDQPKKVTQPVPQQNLSQESRQPSAPGQVNSHQQQANAPQFQQQQQKFQGVKRQPQQQQQQQQQQQSRYQNAYTTNLHRQQQQQQQHQHQQVYSQPTLSSPQQSIAARKFRPSPQHGRCFVALYDYMAGDIDEVTFCEGDVIVNGEPIEGGWMIGTVLRNGQRGMLPANYVEAAA